MLHKIPSPACLRRCTRKRTTTATSTERATADLDSRKGRQSAHVPGAVTSSPTHHGRVILGRAKNLLLDASAPTKIRKLMKSSVSAYGLIIAGCLDAARWTWSASQGHVRSEQGHQVADVAPHLLAEIGGRR